MQKWIISAFSFYSFSSLQATVFQMLSGCHVGRQKHSLLLANEIIDSIAFQRDQKSPFGRGFILLFIFISVQSILPPLSITEETSLFDLELEFAVFAKGPFSQSMLVYLYLLLTYMWSS